MKYKTQGVCAQSIDFDIKDGRVHNVTFWGGCPGNAKAVGKLIEGMPVEEAISRLKGIQCRNGTSCADQLAKALSAQDKK